MSVEQATAEGIVKSLEDEVAAFKTAQPFYDGQFTTTNIKTNNVYDFTFVTNYDVTRYDFEIEITTTNQPNVILEPYFEFFLIDGTPLQIDKVNYLTNHHPIYPGGLEAYIELNITTYNVAIGTTIGVKLFYLVSGKIEGNSFGGVRP